MRDAIPSYLSMRASAKPSHVDSVAKVACPSSGRSPPMKKLVAEAVAACSGRHAEMSDTVRRVLRNDHCAFASYFSTSAPRYITRRPSLNGSTPPASTPPTKTRSANCTASTSWSSTTSPFTDWRPLRHSDFYELIVERHRKASTVITSNQGATGDPDHDGRRRRCTRSSRRPTNSSSKAKATGNARNQPSPQPPRQ